MPSTVTRKSRDRQPFATSGEQECEVCTEILRNTLLFSGLSEEQLRLIAPPCRQLPVAEGQVLFNKGGEATELYVVLSGEFCLEDEISVQDRLPAKSIVVERVGKNGALGLCSLLRPYRWFFTARCTRDAQVIVVRSDDLKAMMKSHPSIGMAVLENAFNISFERLMSSHQRVLAELGLAAMYGANRRY
ncbi:MAG TPA: cyclic nucleotide-binding domain-containing protein [Anaerolineae bacterium]|nr:cyclic nucleotide-binding domain-containing protein [Anaerolineae bacterium]